MKLPRLMTLVLTLNFVFVYSSYAKGNQFFSESIRNEMRSDITGFLKSIPQNEGQQQHINRILENSQYKEILLLIDCSFSPEVIEKISKNEELFSLIEVLDILSYNLRAEDSFSNWYLSRLVSLVENKPSLYLVSFLRFCQQSDGVYSEWFADPLVTIISSYPKEFSVALDEINGWEKICSILWTGNFQKVITVLIYYEKEEFSNVRKLLNCLRKERQA